tara:strand:+ start:28 stop:1440 length:1413 start_codon:yes stop_codon:yes gene_type:complete
MIINNLNSIKSKKFFVIIIGSGPAGISSAIELEKKNIECLIIEAGDKDSSTKNLEYLKGETKGHAYNNLESSRLRQFGGTGNAWGGNCNPMSENDFDQWPIEKKDLDIYEKSAKAILNLKNDFFSNSYSKNLNIYNIDWSDVKFGIKYYEYISKSKYIHLSLNTIFENFNGVNGNVDSITCFKKERYSLKSKYFILSCGGIENNRLLLWSKICAPKLFTESLPIGNYYMDHPFYSIGEGIINYKKLDTYIKKNDIKNAPLITCDNLINVAANKKFLLEKNILNSGLYIGFQNAYENDSIFKQLRCMAPNFIKKIYDERAAKNLYKIEIEVLQEQKAIFDRKITLSKKLDPLRIPQSKLNWWKDPAEKLSAKVISEEFIKILMKNDIGRVGLEEFLFNYEDYETSAGYHQMGGTRMGDNQKDSVVDKNLKIHGITNLFVSGSSVFRTSSYSHPTYTIVKLALRLSDHLSKL